MEVTEGLWRLFGNYWMCSGGFHLNGFDDWWRIITLSIGLSFAMFLDKGNQPEFLKIKNLHQPNQQSTNT